MSAGKTGREQGTAIASGKESEVLSTEGKKEVIWRWEGSLAAPANWRFVRGADMMAVCRVKVAVGKCVGFIVLVQACSVLLQGKLHAVPAWADCVSVVAWTNKKEQITENGGKEWRLSCLSSDGCGHFLTTQIERGSVLEAIGVTRLVLSSDKGEKKRRILSWQTKPPYRRTWTHPQLNTKQMEVIQSGWGFLGSESTCGWHWASFVRRERRVVSVWQSRFPQFTEYHTVMFVP